MKLKGKKIFAAKKNNSREITVWGTGIATRGFLHVEDAARGIVMATQKYDKSEPVNIGTDFEISIKDLTNLICQIIGFRGKVIWDRTKPDGQPKRKLDTNLARKEIGFVAKTNFKEGLINTIKWFEKNLG